MNKFKPLKPKKTSDFAVDAIWELIHSGELKPGDKLPPERELAKRFGISIISLREALQKLETYGHIKKMRGKTGGSIILEMTNTPGMEIAARNMIMNGITASNMNQAVLYYIKTLYELVLEQISKSEIDRLKKIVQKQRQEFEAHRGSVLGWSFPVEVIKCLENPVFESVVEYLMLILMQFEFSIGIDDVGSTEPAAEYNREAVEFNEKIITAFEKKDRQMIGTAFSEMAELLEKNEMGQ